MALFFDNQHSYTQARQEAKYQLITSIAAALESEVEPDLSSKLIALASKSSVSKAEQEQLLVEGWITAIDRLLSHGELTELNRHRLLAFARSVGLNREALNGDEAVTMLAKAQTLAEVMCGQVPDRGSSISPPPIKVLQNECIVWVFPQSRYLEDTTQDLYVEGTSGVSVHVRKGVYYHASSFKGHPVDHGDRAYLDTGTCVATSRNLYFVGSSKTMRIPYTQIVSFYPFSNGVGVTRDAAAAKLQAFATGDGWFTYNLFTNLARF